MAGWIVRPYDALVGRLLMRGPYRRIAAAVTADVPSGGRVLDIGTGPGRLVVAAARQRPDLAVTGIDPSADMLRVARANAAAVPNATFVEAPAEQLPFEDGSQDTVLSSLSSHHWQDLSLALAEQIRVLRPGGQLWLFDLRGHIDAALPDTFAASGIEPVAELPDLGWLARRRFLALRGRRPAV